MDPPRHSWSTRHYQVGIRYGHFYAYTLVDELSPKLDIDDGVVRISLVHYNTIQEVNRILAILKEILEWARCIRASWLMPMYKVICWQSIKSNWIYPPSSMIVTPHQLEWSDHSGLIVKSWDQLPESPNTVNDVILKCLHENISTHRLLSSHHPVWHLAR